MNVPRLRTKGRTRVLVNFEFSVREMPREFKISSEKKLPLG